MFKCIFNAGNKAIDNGIPIGNYFFVSSLFTGYINIAINIPWHSIINIPWH